MINLKGIGASNGVAVEKIYYINRLDLSYNKLENQEVEVEMKRFIDAENTAIFELDLLYEKAKLTNEDTAKVFEIHQMLIADLDFTESIESEISKGKNAEYAIDIVSENFKTLFENMDDEVLKARAADVIDIRNRLIRILKRIKDNTQIPEGKFIIVGEEILPSDIVKFDSESIGGFVSKSGSKTSHAVILARTFNLPIIIQVEKFEEIPQQGIIAIDGKTGEVIINPNDEIINHYQELISKEEELIKGLEKYRGVLAQSKSNHQVLVAANVGNVDDVDFANANDADAIGLFRSEFIYIESEDYPSEEKQFSIYKTVLSKMAPKNVIIRTLDIGADKVAKYFNLEKEENPALGYRAIRICLDKPEIFKTQLRALYRSSIYGSLSIMFPMISHTEQVSDIKVIIKEIKTELDNKKIPYSKDVKIGIMIETPSAVLLSDKLAKMVDFFSIGTNDLTQYTLAVDRMNNKISYLFDSGYESIKRSIAITAKNAHEANIWVGICGESASDLTLLDFYLETKIDELSVSPSQVLRLKKEIIER